MSVLVKGDSFGVSSNVLLAKGAPDRVLTRCSAVMLPGGEIQPLTAAVTTEVKVSERAVSGA